MIYLCVIIWCSESYAQANKTYKVGNVEFTMVFVKAGTFTMGHTVEQGSNCNPATSCDTPAHKVVLTRNYYIGQTEVTQALWQEVMGDNPSFDKGDSKPISNVSWDDCMEFINRLNSKTGEKFRLPTEAEWEFAARGGVKTKMYKHSGGNKLSEVAWSGMDEYDFKLHPVATKKPNELGIYDMSGNVWEWCSDLWILYLPEYKVRTQTDPKGPTREMRSNMPIDEHVIRGESGYGVDSDYHLSRRGFDRCDMQKDYIGLRLAR